jgi:hypothetical protein
MRLLPGEGADQHEQGRLGQVEIGHQHVGGAEAVAGRDEDVGLGGEGAAMRSSAAWRFPSAE